ncbi:hypothetical protein MIND_00104300 [Mycena indigotica]|uniref:Uncharacterized protein n=1 Tax=Mycena indigotica TaxID=2126181 RepID=A0A8H6TDW7_9AGAR|nr:uncharacterized protein MIND_00104300 [Mycena indigotica]KAF7315878.1 hypothetical protein MIND_00104300 [Mycena indigotica]
MPRSKTPCRAMFGVTIGKRISNGKNVYSLRRRYLHLLLVYPSSKEAKDAGTHLWMQTSYSFIALYKSRLTRITNNNPVEGRKLNQRFRQFLAEEERFWQALVLRVQRTHNIALPTSVALPPELSGVGIDEEAVVGDSHSPERGRNNDFGFPVVSDPSPVSQSTAASILSKALICLGDIARYREQYRPPPKIPPHVPEPRRKLYEHKPNYGRARMMYLAAQALLPSRGKCCPSARYFGRLRRRHAGECDVVSSGALCPGTVRYCWRKSCGGTIEGICAIFEDRGRLAEREREEEAEPVRVRVEKFKRDLVLLHAVWREGDSPETTQLALSKHAARVFSSLISARALPEEMIVRVGIVAQGTLWASSHLPPAPPKSEGEETEDQSKGKERDRKRRSKPKPTIIPPAPASAEQQQQLLAHILRLHTTLLEVGIRQLDEVDVYIGAPVATAVPIPLPHVAGGRSRRTRPGRNHPNPPPQRVIPREDAQSKQPKKTELAERITAVFRRTLPALRVGSKWIMANWDLVTVEGERNQELVAFWAIYAKFMRLLAKTFPEEELPPLTRSVGPDDQPQVAAELELEEDLDMRGWLPLRGLMGGPIVEGGEETPLERENAIWLNEGVPNVEQLMRIRDLLTDGRKMAGKQDSPLAMYGDKFVLKGVEAEKPLPARLAPNLASIRDSSLALRDAREMEEDAMTEQTSRTADDLIHDAFSFLNTDGDENNAQDSDEDEIVWDPRGTTAPISPPSPLLVPQTAQTSPKTPVRPAPMSPSSSRETVPGISSIPPSVGVIGAPPTSSFLAPKPPSPPITASAPVSPGMQVPGTTALDLLNNVLSKAKLATKPQISIPPSLAPPGPMSGDALWSPAQQHVQSIWSAARDEPGLMIFSGGGSSVPAGFSATTLPTQAYQQHRQQQHQRFASQETFGGSQSTIWSSQESQLYQHVPVGPIQPYSPAPRLWTTPIRSSQCKSFGPASAYRFELDDCSAIVWWWLWFATLAFIAGWGWIASANALYDPRTRPVHQCRWPRPWTILLVVVPKCASGVAVICHPDSALFWLAFTVCCHICRVFLSQSPATKTRRNGWRVLFSPLGTAAFVLGFPDTELEDCE